MYESVIALTIWENERTKKTHNIASNKLNNIVFIMYIYLLHAFKPEKKNASCIYLSFLGAHISNTLCVNKKWNCMLIQRWRCKVYKRKKKNFKKKKFISSNAQKVDEIKNKKNFNTPKQKYYQKILNATANRKQNPVISKASFSCALEIL